MRSADTGFSLVELLLVTIIVSVLTATTLVLLDPARGIFRLQPEIADVQQRSRIGLDALRRDILAAGAGLDVGPLAGSLVSSLPPVLPYRIGTTNSDVRNGVFARPDVITLIYVPAPHSQSALREWIADGAAPIAVQSMPGCPAGDALCGFSAGDEAIVFDGRSRWDVVRITGADAALGWLLHADDRLTNWYEAGASVAPVVARTYWIKRDGSEASLYRYDGYKTESEVTDRVAFFQVEYFGIPSAPQLPAPPPAGVDDAADTWPAGENCLFARDALTGEPRSRLAPLAADNGSLARLDSSRMTDGPWCPDAAAANRFDADLLRIRRVRVTLRVSSPLGRLVPDREVRLDISPRNLNLER